MTRITINLPLVDAQLCDGCPMLDNYVWCNAFRDYLTHREYKAVRLPECIAATVEEVERG